MMALTMDSDVLTTASEGLAKIPEGPGPMKTVMMAKDLHDDI